MSTKREWITKATEQLWWTLAAWGPDLVILGLGFLGAKTLIDYLNQPKTDTKAVDRLLRNIETRQKRSTKIKLDAYETFVAADIITPEDIAMGFEDIGGLEDVKQAINETVLLQLQHPELFSRGKLLTPPKGILLYGPPGTGKTMMAKAIAKTTESTFLNINLATIFQKWLGESEKIISAIFSLAEKIEPCIIFCDEVDSWLASRSDRDHEVTTRIKALFMSLWDGLLTNPNSRITIIAATNRPAALDDAILRRLPLTFHVDLPDVKQREQILSIILKGEHVAPEVSIRQIAENTPGYSGSDLKALCQVAARGPVKDFLKTNTAIDANSSKELRPIEYADFIEAKQSVQPTGESARAYANLVQQRELATSPIASPYIRTPQQERQRPVTINVNFMPVMQNPNVE